MLQQLLAFQRNYVIAYSDLPTLPVCKKFDYDFLGYLLDNQNLGQSCEYQFDTQEDRTMSQDRFLENVYFGRKRNFGKSFISRIQ
jgi:hypothetical protein